MPKYKTIIRVWSRNGHTPLTNRQGAYCDELVKVEIECTDPDEAYQRTKEIKDNTPHAYCCHFAMPDYPNQNTRNRFCHYG